jgi:peptide/nickel transport system ATP-binding protein
MEKKLLAIQNLNIGLGNTQAVKGLSLDILTGLSIGLVGASGSGKSLTGLAVMGLLPRAADVSGAVLFEGENLLALDRAAMNKIRGSRIAMIFQEPMTSLNPVMTVVDQIAESVLIHESVPAEEARARARTLLDEVGINLGPRGDRVFPHELSGGQRQRVMIAIAIACKPRLLIADEPTTALDVTVQKQILDLISNLQKKYQMAVLYITHDLGLIRRRTERVYVVAHGEIIESGGTEDVFINPRQDGTKALLSVAWQRPSRTSENGPVLLELKNVSKVYDSQVSAMKDVSVAVRRGRTLGVVGESGSGKTTLGRTVLRLVSPSQGQILFSGKDVNRLKGDELRDFRKGAQMIFQDPYSSLNPRHRIDRVLMEPMEVHGIGAGSSDRRERAEQLMKRVGLDPSWLVRYPHEFSGGQRQRVCIARAVSLEPEFIVCDEAVSALDTHVRADILKLLSDLKTEMGLTYLFISHDLNVVRAFTDDVAVMCDGVIVEQGVTEEVYSRPRLEYTKRLLAAVNV